MPIPNRLSVRLAASTPASSARPRESSNARIDARELSRTFGRYDDRVAEKHSQAISGFRDSPLRGQCRNADGSRFVARRVERRFAAIGEIAAAASAVRRLEAPRNEPMNNQMPMAVWRAGMDKIEAAARAVDMPLRMDNANALPTYPQQKQQEAA